jgi:NAD(P)-dependent dehydrogenase (short-subunit alcohol dehydrogenase family)
MDNRPVVVMTGATNGLGRLAALDLARRCAGRFGIIARSEAKADALRLDIDAAAPGTPVDVFRANLSLLRDVRRAGLEIVSRYPRIDMLINNAGLHAFSQRITAEGFAEMTAVNYLAPWLLTETLRDSLVASSPARIVNVASEASRHSGGIDPRADIARTDDYTRRESSRFYGRTKLMDIMFTQELARRLAGTGVSVNCCDPGFKTTGLGRELPFAGTLEKILTRLGVGDPRRGARIIVRLATDPEFATATGGYLSVRSAKPLVCPEPGHDENISLSCGSAPLNCWTPSGILGHRVVHGDCLSANGQEPTSKTRPSSLSTRACVLRTRVGAPRPRTYSRPRKVSVRPRGHPRSRAFAVLWRRHRSRRNHRPCRRRQEPDGKAR